MSAALLAQTPALPLHQAGKYVAGAYVVLFALVLIYVAIMAMRLNRVERELDELLEQAQAAGEHGPLRPEELAARAATPGQDAAQLQSAPESTPV